MVDILQLHRKAPYPPSSGADRRVWEAAKKFAEFGNAWCAAPWNGSTPSSDVVHPLDIETILLTSKISRIHLWTLLLAVGADTLNDAFKKRCFRALESTDMTPDVVVSECPQLSPAAFSIARESGSSLIIDKHNAEFRVVDQFLKSKRVPDKIRKHIVTKHRDFEQNMIELADAVVFMSEDDCKPFDLTSTHYEVIPNGTHYSEISAKNKHFLNISGLELSKPVCIFIGSYDYEPNRDAADTIIHDIAPSCPEVQFLLVGRNPPNTDQPNVVTPGFVDDLGSCLASSDIALCPLSMGSGTKLKMLDYMAAGLPIVTTPVGTQGLKTKDGQTVLITRSASEMIDAIEKLVASDEIRTRLGNNAQKLGKQYDWGTLLSKYNPLIEKVTQE
jgi:glycosyltransferase involved in cell wall biosynthesis